MLQNTRVTAFTISKLSRENQQGVKLPSSPKIRVNQEVWLESYIDMNKELRIKPSDDSEKDFFKLMNNAVFTKTKENMRIHSDIKLVTTKARRKYLVFKSNYHTTTKFSENLLAIRKKLLKILANKPVCLGLSILEMSETVKYEFWYGYVKRKYGEKAKLC